MGSAVAAIAPAVIGAGKAALQAGSKAAIPSNANPLGQGMGSFQSFTDQLKNNTLPAASQASGTGTGQALPSFQSFLSGLKNNALHNGGLQNIVNSAINPPQSPAPELPPQAPIQSSGVNPNLMQSVAPSQAFGSPDPSISSMLGGM